MASEQALKAVIEREYLRDTLQALVRPLEPKHLTPYLILPLVALIVLFRGSLPLGVLLLVLSAAILAWNVTSRGRYINKVIKQAAKTVGAKPIQCRLELFDSYFTLTCKELERTYTIAYDNLSQVRRQGDYLLFRCYADFDAVLKGKAFAAQPAVVKAFASHARDAQKEGVIT